MTSMPPAARLHLASATSLHFVARHGSHTDLTPCQLPYGLSPARPTNHPALRLRGGTSASARLRIPSLASGKEQSPLPLDTGKGRGGFCSDLWSFLLDALNHERVQEMSATNKISCLLLTSLLFTLLTACQSVPIASTKSQFLQQPTSGHGRVLITTLHIPEDEPGVQLFYILGALAGANTQVPLQASVYDVTNGIHYIGSLMGRHPYGWLEYEAPMGQRTLMLTSTGNQLFPTENSLLPHVDFIEINVEPGTSRYVVLSQYGLLKMPYFGEVFIENKHWNGCLALDEKNPRKRREVVENHMKVNSINTYARDFSHFCEMLSTSKNVLSPNDHAKEQFAQVKPVIEKLRIERFEKWQSENERRLAYDLMRIYEPVVHKP